MKTFALDADIISYMLRGDTQVLLRLHAEQDMGNEFGIPPMAYYEVKRGLLAVGSIIRLRLYEEICRDFSVGVMSTAAWDEAARLYARQRRRGRSLEDADLLIAAFCLVGGYILVTNNTKHFEMIDGLVCLNWKQ
ncbi:MAG: PIN domain-containing protein [Desulfovibrio sp.]|jgi:tRNA(fMet)-specific endonuclease VapC|nr:PIN domain-containing protein [Desulfovibrio sp.]